MRFVHTGWTIGAILILVWLPSACSRAVASAKLFPRLADVRQVYVAPFGSSADADSVRERVRQLLVSSERFLVVDSPSVADAILGGTAGVRKRETTNVQVDDASGITATAETNHVGFGLLRLLTPGSPDTVWTFEYRVGMSREKPAVRVANQAVQRLLADAAEADSVREARRDSR